MTPAPLDLPALLIENAADFEGPVLSVDGAWGAPGLNLSHWPGNTTPAPLRHALSTGSALAFAGLPATERETLTRGLLAVVNNHFDTDGLCAMWTVLHPERALEHAPRLLAIAAAGDFFAYPDDHALAVDALIGALPDAERSPIAASFRGLDDRTRRQRAMEYGLAELGAWLASDLDAPPLAEHRAVWGPELERARADAQDLARCGRTDLAAIDLTAFTSPPGLLSRGPGRDGTHFTPGRHALFAAAGRDRVLVSAPHAAGWTHRLVVGTRSWFDLPENAPPPRFDLGSLARALEADEGSAGGDLRWRHQPTASPSPELWFGAKDVEFFSEENPALAPSRLTGAHLLEHLARLAPAARD